MHERPCGLNFVDVARDRTRRLAAVWFADIVGYTALSNRGEDAALAIVDEFQRLAHEAIGDKGRVVKFLGDGALAVFDSTNRALESAIALREAFDGLEVVRSHDCSLSVGVHVGEVVTAEDGDVYGDGVNLAARIEGVATAGQIVVSEEVYRLIRNRSKYDPQSIGQHSLKGVDKPATLYVLARPGETVAVPESALAGAAGAAAADRPPEKTSAWHRKAVAVGIAASVVGFILLSVFVASSVTVGEGSREEGEEGGDAPAAVARDQQSSPAEDDGGQASGPLPDVGRPTDPIAGGGDPGTDTQTTPVDDPGPQQAGDRPTTAAETPDEGVVDEAPRNGLLVIVYGDGPGPRLVEGSILRSLRSRGEVRVMDASSLALIRGDEPAVRSALEGDFASLASLGRRHGAEFMIVGDLQSTATQAVGPMFGGSAQLELRMYRVSTGEVVNSAAFRVGMGGEPAKPGRTALDAQTEAALEAGRQGATAARGWLVWALRD